MSNGSEVLRQVLTQSGFTQSELSRISGVKQPSISQFLSGQTKMSDVMLGRLLACMGYRLEVVRQPVKADLRRSPQRSWMLHRQLATHLTEQALQEWIPIAQRNLQRLAAGVQGEPHTSNLRRWEELLTSRDVRGIRLILTGVDTESIQMREVSPLSGLLPPQERDQVLAEIRK